MGELQALLFDVDGTLADTEEIHRQAFNQSFTNAGLAWHWSLDLYGRLLTVTGGRERIRYYIDNWPTDFQRPNNLDGYIADLHRDKTAIYVEAIANGGVPLRPGVRRLLREALVEGLRLAIATTTSPANVTSLLRASLDPDAESWFELIAAGDHATHKKPAPDIYEYTLDRMSLAPLQCLAIEDSQNGVRSARAAGIPTLVTPSYYTEGEDFSDAALVVDHLGEPDQPFSVLNGEVDGARWVDVALLRRVLHASQESR